MNRMILLTAWLELLLECIEIEINLIIEENGSMIIGETGRGIFLFFV